MGGAPSIRLHELSQKIWELAWSLKMDLVANHIPGVHDTVAKLLSFLATKNPQEGWCPPPPIFGAY